MTLAPEAPTVRVPVRAGSPFVGLVPFGEDDARFFFGRSTEVSIVSANLRSTRLTLLYGPSGVGKSSLLQAGVVHGLRRESLRAHDEPPFAVCVVRSWLGDPIRTLEDAAHAALQELAGDEPLGPPGATLAESLGEWTEQSGRLLVVLDQFEEYFLYHPDEGGDELSGFAAELAEVVNDPAIDVHVLLSIREDAWPQLDRFEGHIPSLFVNYLRVDHLDLAAGREAIEGPVGAWNRTLAPGEQPYYVRPELVDAVIAAAAGGGLAAATGVETGADRASPGDRVEAPFLQLVLERVWRETIAEGSNILSIDTLDRLGGARRIVERHLLDALGALEPRDQDLASDSFRFLVTRARTKIAHPAADLAEWSRRPEAEVTRVLGILCTAEGGRILRAIAPPDEGGSPSYELFHDVLADPLLAWRRRHEAERARRRFRRRLARVGVAALVLVAVFAGLAGWALNERHHTQTLLDAQRTSNAALQQRIDKLSKRNLAARRKAAREASVVTGLTATNERLAAETVVLVKSRNGLDQQIRAARVENAALARQIRTLNNQNTTLAKQVNGLDADYAQLGTELDTLQEQHDQLAGYAGILKAQNAALAAERKELEQANGELERKARALGWRPTFVSSVSAGHQVYSPPPRLERASLFVVPGDTAGSDALRARAASLARQLVQLENRHARSVDQADFLTKANRLLVRQRDVLVLEVARLERTRGTVEGRNATLTQREGAASAEHKRLVELRAEKEARNAKRTKAVAARRKADAALQEHANSQVENVGSAQGDVTGLNADNAKLVAFIDPRVGKVIAASRSGKQDAKLAGLLAVKAAHLTSYEPDDPAHPDAYNALWLALDRLDAKAAAAAIAPAKHPDGKVGTTSSATLEKAICKRAARTLTPAEWAKFMPAGAPYSHAAATPCG